MNELTNQEILLLALSLLAGLGLGLFYYGGLWLTVQAAARARRPALLLLGSFVGRLVVVLGAIYLLGGDQWLRMVAALLGMILMRLYLTHRLGPFDRPGPNPKSGKADKPGNGESGGAKKPALFPEKPTGGAPWN